MICETDLPVSWRTRPRGFVALMGLYESNFLRLGILTGDLLALPRHAVSMVAGDCELQLTVLERARYTSELSLTYVLPATALSAGVQRVPDLRLRVYHDARTVEALPDGRQERELHQCWSRNLMLNKWLEYCVERGHHFG